jgi:hypothetical protein
MINQSTRTLSVNQSTIIEESSLTRFDTGASGAFPPLWPSGTLPLRKVSVSPVLLSFDTADEAGLSLCLPSATADGPALSECRLLPQMVRRVAHCLLPQVVQRATILLVPGCLSPRRRRAAASLLCCSPSRLSSLHFLNRRLFS